MEISASKNKRSFCYIEDFIDAFNILIKKGKHKEIYNIGNTDEVKILDLSKLIISMINKDIKTKISTKPFYNAMRRLPDIKKLNKLGYKPKINLKKGLKKTIDWYKHNHK